MTAAATPTPGPAPAPRPSCVTCSSRAWSGSGQQYDCNAAGGMPLPDEHRTHTPDWCPKAPTKKD